ncbi:MAG: ribosome maturation factor RimP [candidate division Zixibacteria bacterium]|nr:ribosome maturation factor RimP [candidate division Zixibacteria bacterium]
MSEKLKERIQVLVQQPLAEHGCELADMSFSQYRNHATVRLFVYCEGGVSLEKCTHVSRLVGDAIDSTDLFDQGYTLEVSSPGLDRPLTNSMDFRYRIGETVTVEFADTTRKAITARIISADDLSVGFENESGMISCQILEISRAKIVF